MTSCVNVDMLLFERSQAGGSVTFAFRLVSKRPKDDPHHAFGCMDFEYAFTSPRNRGYQSREAVTWLGPRGVCTVAEPHGHSVAWCPRAPKCTVRRTWGCIKNIATS